MEVIIVQVVCTCFFVLTFSSSFSAFFYSAVATLQSFWHGANDRSVWRVIVVGDVVVRSES